MNNKIEFYSSNALWSAEQNAMEGAVDALFSRGLEELISKDTSLHFILQSSIGTVCIPTYISCSNIEHFYTSELG